ncbi:MAG TPA: cytochrome ubiquinol oxidase subunit I, partial [Dehalococcoidia bacterium]|nr:cytochrome ubiquinol oxidase subunit I [Dehalococcoidia bacterium]
VAGASGDGHAGGHEGGHGIHMPSPSVFPLIAALGPPLLGAALIYNEWFAPVGALVMLFGLYGWALEPATEE